MLQLADSCHPLERQAEPLPEDLKKNSNLFHCGNNTVSSPDYIFLC
jgi:hypothetical protein